VRIRALATVAVSGLLVVGAAAALVPGDPNGSHPAYAALNMAEAWDLTTGSPEVVIAIVDSGVDASHPDLAGAVLPGFDFVENAPSTTPIDGHGTGVAGAAAARANNGIGGAGTCFRCSILPLRVIGRDGIAFNTTTARAIDYAVDHGAAVVNASIYGPNFSEPLRRSIQRARAAGVLVVAAAGNEANDTPQYPAAFPETISVGAATYSGARASFSSFGPGSGSLHRSARRSACSAATPASAA
jgi:serine protease